MMVKKPLASTFPEIPISNIPNNQSFREDLGNTPYTKVTPPKDNNECGI